MTVSLNPRECSLVPRHRSVTWRQLLHRWPSICNVLSLTVVALIAFGGVAAATDWDPAAWKDVSTLDFRTTEPTDGEHWSPVWLVVIEGEVYLRLGTRAAGRITRNQTSPIVAVRIAGQQFENVRAEPVPEKAEAVATAMADKYWSDLFVRFFSHPLTMRLVAAPSK